VDSSSKEARTDPDGLTSLSEQIIVEVHKIKERP